MEIRQTRGGFIPQNSLILSLIYTEVCLSPYSAFLAICFIGNAAILFVFILPKALRRDGWKSVAVGVSVSCY